MEKPKEKATIICGPKQPGMDNPGQPGVCHSCLCAVWVSESSLNAVKKAGAVETIITCIKCFPKTVNPNEPLKLLPLSKEQSHEIVNYFLPKN